MMKCISNFQFSADNGYSTDQNTTYLEENWIEGYISTRKLSRKEKKYNLCEKPFQKDNFDYDVEIETYIVLWEKFHIEEEHMNSKTNKE